MARAAVRATLAEVQCLQTAMWLSPHESSAMPTRGVISCQPVPSFAAYQFTPRKARFRHVVQRLECSECLSAPAASWSCCLVVTLLHSINRVSEAQLPRTCCKRCAVLLLKQSSCKLCSSGKLAERQHTAD
jgi:hypothetical protein